LTSTANAYWLMGVTNFITTERIDPIVNPGAVSGHAHSVLGGSNFGFTSSTEHLLKSECTSIPIPEDKSNYWFPHLYFQWANGSVTSLTGGAVIYYLFDNKPGTTTAFPPDFRMISGNPTLRSYDPNSFAQQAIDFLCLDFDGTTTKHTGLPNKACKSGIRAQVNFPSCWDGKNVDSPNHKSHVAFRSEGPDTGKCLDPNFPVTLPRIFLEVYWGSGQWDKFRSEAMNPEQPFVYAYGDATGYGNHADFFNGWEPGVLQKAVDGCNCNIYGDFSCCVEKGIFNKTKDKKCFITPSVNEPTTGTLAKLPGNNPIQPAPGPAVMNKSDTTPGIIAPVYVYTNTPTATGKVVTAPSTGAPQVAPTVSPTIISSSAIVSVTYGASSSSSPIGAPTSTVTPATSVSSSSSATVTPT
ncbi:hypothetical protein B0H34DRAFT_628672, partial [Crassisporium funariophilum]